MATVGCRSCHATLFNGSGCWYPAYCRLNQNWATKSESMRHTVPLLRLALVFAALCGRANAGEGSFCALLVPPVDAGHYAMMGVAMRVYPGPSEIDSSYTGCQTLWSTENGKTEVQIRVVFRNGTPIAMEGALPSDSSPLECTRTNVANAARYSCEPLGPIPFPSYPADCIKFRASPADSQGHFIADQCK